MSKKVLFIVGSFRQGSFNHQLATQAENILTDKAEVSYLDFKDILSADAIWIFSPTYNWSIPGVVKNLLDWLSRALDLSDPTGPSALNEKLVTVSSVANGTSPDEVFKHYRSLLPFIRMNVVEPFTGVAVNPEAWGTGQLTVSEEKQAELAAQAEALLAAIN